MAPIPDNVWDKDKYREAIKAADESYKVPSAYKSMYIVRKYKELGGEYSKSKKKEANKRQRTDDWLKEEWIQLSPYLEDKKKVACGRNKGAPNACRPLKNVKGGDKNLTVKDILDKWGMKKVKSLVKEKLEDMEGRLNWKTGTFSPSGKK